MKLQEAASVIVRSLVAKQRNTGLSYTFATLILSKLEEKNFNKTQMYLIFSSLNFVPRFFKEFFGGGSLLPNRDKLVFSDVSHNDFKCIPHFLVQDSECE